MPHVAPKRCSWVNTDDRLLLEYHDREWGVPTHDDRRHFEFLVLAQPSDFTAATQRIYGSGARASHIALPVTGAAPR
jgi:hypothetical protein